MSTSVPEITAEQRKTLEQFRKVMSDDLVDTHDDYFLIRWLRARKWNLEAAEKMLRACLKTRAMWNVENIEKWDAPKALREYLPYGLLGFDNEGSPVIVCKFANFDIWGMMHCVTRFEFQKYLVLLLERFMTTAYEQSLKHGWRARQLVVFFDMQDVNLKQYAWRPAAECIMSSVRQYEANFPELLKMCYIINAPILFSVAFNIVRKFLNEYTIKKINIYKVGSDKWQQQLFSHVDRRTFPKCWGGELVDKLGDPECKSLMVWGGKIPHDLFVSQNDQDESDKDFMEATVSKGEKFKLDFHVGMPAVKDTQQQILSWEFRTFDYDIKFGIYSVDQMTGEKRSEVDLGTVSSNEMDEIGFISTRPNTTYTVVFDNSGSYLRSKKLRYWVSLVAEDDIGDINKLSTQLESTEIVARQ